MFISQLHISIMVYILTIGLVSAQGLNAVIENIQRLEAKQEPKCYATASRLEDFMFGTPLADDTRFTKNLLQKRWAKRVWQDASLIAKSKGKSAVKSKHIEQAIKNIFTYETDSNGHWILNYRTGTNLKINKNDKRQYSSIAYSLRALLAVQQEALLDLNSDLLPLSQEAVDTAKNALDLFTLSVLKISDEKARMDGQYEMKTDNLSSVWSLLLDPNTDSVRSTRINSTALHNISNKNLNKINKLKMLKSIIEQKVKSYATYNEISQQLFIRNLQVYFARNRWPKDPQVGKQFRNLFASTLIAFAADLYKGAENIATKNSRALITEADVNQFAKNFIPHRINEYEDAIFFPKLARKEQIVIESYDMDAFRDSGIHWLYLQHAISSPQFKTTLEPDPFAAELIAENIAQFGVLVFRVTGLVGREQGTNRIALAHFGQAIQLIQDRVNKHVNIKPTGISENIAKISSSNTDSEISVSKQFFTDVSEELGVKFMHRSSDWLNRLLRTYLNKDKHTGIITIPPAFGGSGVAAEDINNDGLPDILILSGLGNRLYANRGSNSFEDITTKAGLKWYRHEDKRPGEPRQPLIMDLNNDGLQDIIITYVDDDHRVYKNLGNEKFQDVTNTARLGGKNLVGGPATVFDFDNDGLLDIYITYFGDYIHGELPTLKRRNRNGLPNKLFRNIGNFIFKDVTDTSNLDDSGWGQAVTHTDLNSDGLQDVIAGNDFGVNAYFKNMGGGRFKEISETIGTDKPSYTMSIGLADLNDDLLPDIYISNIVTMNKDEKYVLPTSSTTMKFNPDKLANMRVVEANDLFLSSKGENGSISYKLSHVVGRGYSSTGWSWDADFFDFDNDGDDDLYVLNGMNEFNLYSSENPYYTDPLENKKRNVYIPVSTKESNVFFVNDGGRLQNYSRESGAALLGNSRSAAYFDFDQDGDMDIILNNYHEASVLYRNNSERFANNWLKVKLVGDPKQGVSRDAIGARMIVTTKNGNKVWREVHGSIGYMSVHPKEQHFGIGKQKKADLLVIWPNGKRMKYPDLSVNQRITINQAGSGDIISKVN